MVVQMRGLSHAPSAEITPRDFVRLSQGAKDTYFSYFGCYKTRADVNNVTNLITTGQSGEVSLSQIAFEAYLFNDPPQQGGDKAVFVQRIQQPKFSDEELKKLEQKCTNRGGKVNLIWPEVRFTLPPAPNEAKLTPATFSLATGLSTNFHRSKMLYSQLPQVV